MPTITRKLEFDYGHRVLGHEGKCKHLHGHRGVAEISVSAKELDDISRVVDFSVIKKEVGGWIDANWDHNMLLNADDPILRLLTSHAFGGKYPYRMPEGRNPTAEVMAELLYLVCLGTLKEHGIQVERVRLYETPNCWADYTRDDARQ